MKFSRVLTIWSAVMLIVVSLAACAAGGGTSSSSVTSTPNHTVKVTVTPGDTSLCEIVSVSEFGQVVGAALKLNKNSQKMSSGAVQVNCAYLPTDSSNAGGGIVFAVTSDGPAFYTKLQQEEQGQLNSMKSLSGVGDNAFWGTDSSSPDILNLDMLKDNVVVGITMDGSASDGSSYLPGAEQIAKELASKL